MRRRWQDKMPHPVTPSYLPRCINREYAHFASQPNRCLGERPARILCHRWRSMSSRPAQSPTASPPVRWWSEARHIATHPSVLLFGLFGSVYALTSAGRLDSADGVVVAQTARALFQHHTLALSASTPDVVIGVGGSGYSKYGIAQSLVEIPFVALGFLLRHLTHNEQTVEWTISFTNVFVSALGGALLYLVARRLGASQRLSIGLTLLYGFGTLAWPYAKTDFTEPLQTVSLLAALYAVLRAQQSAQPRWLWAAGGALAVTGLTKSAMLVVVPSFSLYLALADLVAVESGAMWSALRKAQWWREELVHQIALLSPVILAVGITLWLNQARFGSPLDFGYGRAVGDVPLSGSIVEGVFGLLLSFNTGLLFYATPVILGLIGLRQFSRRHPAEAVLIGALSLSMLVLYGSFRFWAGLAAYGPRYLVPLVPFLLLPAINAFPPAAARTAAWRWAVLGVAAVAALGLAEQLLGVLVSFGAYSTLTCHQTPCPASLDASQSEILYDLWLLPASLAYNVLGHAPHIVLSAYPFGAAPLARPNWQADLADRMRYFWFVFLPHPLAFLAGGLVIWGTTIALCLASLWRRVAVSERMAHSEHGAMPVMVAAGSRAHDVQPIRGGSDYMPPPG